MNTRLLAGAACALALTAAASAAAAPATTRAPQLSWSDVRLGSASDVLVLPLHPRALAIVLHGGEIAKNRSRAVLATRVAARVYSSRLAPLGIGVLSVDYRWSVYGGAELQDVEDALARDGGDPLLPGLPRILIGASHGGYLAALAATTASARTAHVAAVVDLYGFANLGATVSEASSRYDPESRLTLRRLGPPAAAASAYRARSPLALAGSLTAPMFQAVGGRDSDTLPDVLALTRALRREGRTPELHVLPGIAHGFAFGSSVSPLVWREIGVFLRRLGLARP